MGDTPEDTYSIAAELKKQGYRAAKFGWGPIGQYDEDFDIALVKAAREGMSEDAQIMVDAGVVWGTLFEAAYQRKVFGLIMIRLNSKTRVPDSLSSQS